MRKRDPSSLTRRVEALDKQGLDAKEIARRLNADVQRVRELRCKVRNADRYKATAEAVRRRSGVRPATDANAERAATSAARLRAIQPLLKRGLSWGQAAKRLGISRNVIAGLTHRAKMRSVAAEARRA